MTYARHDSESVAAETNRPVCNSCGQPIWEEKAYEVNGCFFCRDNDGCEDDFMDLIKKIYITHIDECA